MTPEQNASLQSLAIEIFRKKTERRRQLARLSFEEKIYLVVRMQNLAWEICQQMRKPGKKPWWFVKRTR